MRVINLLTTVSAVSGLAAAWTPDSTFASAQLVARGVFNLARYVLTHPLPKCSITTRAIRQEWHTLSASQKTSWISAVQCLQSLPSKSGSFAPGAQSRYDDFVAVHVNSTLFIHGTGNFLSWHRYFLWSFEQALRNECGYNGYQPYLNYGKIASNPLGAPVFDGSSTSISGNGGYKAYAGVKIPSAAVPLISLPPGQGGDCVTSGPFASMSVNLGPLSPVFTDVPANPQPDGLGYNPRCLRRDISQFASSTATTDQNVTDLISQNTNIADFQNTLQGNFGAGEIGIHTAAHYIVGGDAGGDIFTSPGDPFFWLHHAMIDRIWWIWQNQDPLNRMNVIAGTITLLNNPPSRDATLNDIIDLGVVAASGTIPISSAVYTLGGPFCYIYM